VERNFGDGRAHAQPTHAKAYKEHRAHKPAADRADPLLVGPWAPGKRIAPPGRIMATGPCLAQGAWDKPVTAAMPTTARVVTGP